MWLFYLLLAVVATQAGKRQQVTKGLFPGGQNQKDFKGDSQISISGTGMIGKNGKTSLNIQVQIAPAAGQVGGAGPGGPGGAGARGPGAGAGGPGAGAGGPGAGTAGPGARAGAGGPGAGAGGPGVGAGGPGAGPGGPGAGAGVGPGGPGAGGPGAGAGGGEFTQEEQIGLAAHNEFRQVHQVPPMTLDRQMCDQAKAYAQTLVDMGTLKHSSKQEREGQGENLSMGCSTNKPQAMEEAVKNWYNEVCDPGYNFNSGGFSSGTGHFTQVVWKGSTILGIGRAEGEEQGMKCAYIVGRYKPAGNVMGKFPENVPKGDFDASYCDSIKKRSRKFFDDQRQTMIIDSSLSAVDVPIATAGAAEFRRQQNVLLTSKKKKTNILK